MSHELRLKREAAEKAFEVSKEKDRPITRLKSVADSLALGTGLRPLAGHGAATLAGGQGQRPLVGPAARSGAEGRGGCRPSWVWGQDPAGFGLRSRPNGKEEKETKHLEALEGAETRLRLFQMDLLDYDSIVAAVSVGI
ncbi:hypothetical protein Tco_1004585 [Tanacetum coccineum]|uniref:Uncharacterized protein n=1 Tax=Tanacetum coccineum TaxID=301880 RepID=A0ABQ5FCT3_9ASTR